jgi:biotin operon repressor
MIRAAKLASSPRLQAVLAALRRGGWWTAGDIRRATEDKVEAVPTAIQELKANGIEIECRYVSEQYRYRLVGANPCVRPFEIDGQTRGSAPTKEPESFAEFLARHGYKPAAPKEEQGGLF